MTLLRWTWRGVRLITRLLTYAVGLLLFLFLIQRSTYPLYTQWNRIAVTVSDHRFDYVAWEIDALLTKAGQTLWGVHPFMSEDERSQFVRDYMDDLAQAQRLEAEINAIYTDPNVSDPQDVARQLIAERDILRDDLADRQATAEAIIEGQVASVLLDEGFGTLGQLLPPISMHFTQVPNLLIVSPRDEIRFDVSMNLDPMPIDEIAALETQIDTAEDVSSLIVPLGGIALYPAMILETTNITWAVETFAHEWIHHYFFFFPLGLNYFTGDDFAGEARIINETVADIFGEEIARTVLARYYPDLLAAESPQTVSAESAMLYQQPEFDFGTAMHETRTRVDRFMVLIAQLQAKAEDAPPEMADFYRDFASAMVLRVEDYMEQRRQVFYENGFRIRKLNQAYFAFYGGYQGGIPGIGGEDPIGPGVRDIRALSPDVHSFIVTMRDITTREELLAARDRLAGE